MKFVFKQNVVNPIMFGNFFAILVNTVSHALFIYGFGMRVLYKKLLFMLKFCKIIEWILTKENSETQNLHTFLNYIRDKEALHCL